MEQLPAALVFDRDDAVRDLIRNILDRRLQYTDLDPRCGINGLAGAFGFQLLYALADPSEGGIVLTHALELLQRARAIA